MKTVIFTVEAVESLALVIVYPFAMRRVSKRNAISAAPIKSPPKTVNGPIPETAYFVQVTELSKTPHQCRRALSVKSL